MSMLGKCHTERTKKRMSKAQKKRFRNPENHPRGMLGKHHSKIVRNKIRKGNTGKSLSLRTKNKLRKLQRKRFRNKENHPMFGHHHSKKAIKRISKSITKKWQDSKYYDKKRKQNRERWLDPAFARKILASCAVRPNKKEKELRTILNSVIPKVFGYVGDGRVMIDGKNPDFIRVDGKKKQVIEFFGNYWHKKGDGRKRERHFRRNKYGCLIVWQKELKDIDRLSRKILGFAHS